MWTINYLVHYSSQHVSHSHFWPYIISTLENLSTHYCSEINKSRRGPLQLSLYEYILPDLAKIVLEYTAEQMPMRFLRSFAERTIVICPLSKMGYRLIATSASASASDSNGLNGSIISNLVASDHSADNKIINHYLESLPVHTLPALSASEYEAFCPYAYKRAFTIDLKLEWISVARNSCGMTQDTSANASVDTSVDTSANLQQNTIDIQFWI